MDGSHATEVRRHPLFGPNKLKLGTFAHNCDGAAAITRIPDRHFATWDANVAIAQLADEGRFEVMVPIARWRGFGGESQFNGANFETYTWAAGLAASTKHVGIMATSHVPTIHPIVAAKQATTIDHISGGRFGINIVCGWFRPEFQMFGAPMMDHDLAYAYAAEWIEVIEQLWTREDEFDYQGRFFNIARGYHMPKPLQAPRPVLMNAGTSEVGKEFACKYCDVSFQGLRFAPDEVRARIRSYKEHARKTYGRELQVWKCANVVQGDTEADARAFLNHYVNEMGDWEACANMFEIMGINGKVAVSGDQLTEMKRQYIAGWGGAPLVGTAEQIAEGLAALSAQEIDGIALTFPRYEQDLRRFVKEVLPLLEQMGLRTAAA